MATTAFTAAGTTLGVSATLAATHDAAGFGALTFTDVGEIVDFGEVGREYNIVSHNPVGDRSTYKFKGSYDDGTLTMTVGRAEGVTGDSGQTLLKTALDDDNDYAFAIEFNDNPGGTSNTFLYFAGKVTSFRDAIGSVDSIVSKTVTVVVNGDVVEVAAVS